jgi:hypothetical protein
MCPDAEVPKVKMANDGRLDPRVGMRQAALGTTTPSPSGARPLARLTRGGGPTFATASQPLRAASGTAIGLTTLKSCFVPKETMDKLVR